MSPAPERVFRILGSTREPGRCQSCGCAITWVRTYPGLKAMPLTGNPVALSTENVDGDAIETVRSSDSHFASCPQAKRWSKKAPPHTHARGHHG